MSSREEQLVAHVQWIQDFFHRFVEHIDPESQPVKSMKSHFEQGTK